MSAKTRMLAIERPGGQPLRTAWRDREGQHLAEVLLIGVGASESAPGAC